MNILAIINTRACKGTEKETMYFVSRGKDFEQAECNLHEVVTRECGAGYEILSIYEYSPAKIRELYEALTLTGSNSAYPLATSKSGFCLCAEMLKALVVAEQACHEHYAEKDYSPEVIVRKLRN